MDDQSPISRSTAVTRLRAALSGTGASANDATGSTERVDLDRIAGRTLAADLLAPRDVPRYDYSTMDGYAVAAAEDGPREVVGAVFPEDDPPSIGPEEAVEVATGAPLPARADAVVKVEDAVVESEGDGPDRLADPGLAPATNVTPAGTTATDGEVLLSAGDRLAPRHAALLRDVGIDAVAVRPRRSVAVLATGTEIHEGEQPDRDSEMLANLVRAWDHDPTFEGTVPDDADTVRAAIEDLAGRYDLVLTTGGTGRGPADHVSRVLRDHDLLFDGVAIRPGRPVTAAVVDGSLVCGLPGKPLAAHLAATLLLGSALAGDPPLPTVEARIDVDVAMPGEEATFAVPVQIDGEGRADGDGEGRADVEDGVNRAVPLGHVSSSLPIYEERFRPGRVSANTRVTLADGVVLTETDVTAGQRVAVVPFAVVE